MRTDHDEPASHSGSTRVAPLLQALDQSEKVKEKVAEAAVELSDVNARLKDGVARGVTLGTVQGALDKSEAVEEKVQEAAEELVAVNDALAVEVSERDSLHDRIEKSASALSKSVAAEESARHRALHDAVTGLPNVTLFGDRLENALEQAHRHTWRLAVMFLDLDGFKAINDAHGHDVGDRVLQVVAQRLHEAVRGGDSVARRGGDEFLVLMLEVQDDASTLLLASRICARIAEPMVFEEATFTVGTSLGIAVFPEDAETPAELLRGADLAMYVAKKGRIGIARFTSSPV